MIALVLMTCSLAGADCRPVMAADGLNLMECMVRAQQEAARYQSDHPNRRAVRFICTDSRQLDFILGRGAA